MDGGEAYLSTSPRNVTLTRPGAYTPPPVREAATSVTPVMSIAQFESGGNGRCARMEAVGAARVYTPGARDSDVAPADTDADSHAPKSDEFSAPDDGV